MSGEGTENSTVDAATNPKADAEADTNPKVDAVEADTNPKADAVEVDTHPNASAVDGSDVEEWGLCSSDDLSSKDSPRDKDNGNLLDSISHDDSTDTPTVG